MPYHTPIDANIQGVPDEGSLSKAVLTHVPLPHRDFRLSTAREREDYGTRR